MSIPINRNGLSHSEAGKLGYLKSREILNMFEYFLCSFRISWNCRSVLLFHVL